MSGVRPSLGVGGGLPPSAVALAKAEVLQLLVTHIVPRPDSYRDRRSDLGDQLTAFAPSELIEMID